MSARARVSSALVAALAAAFATTCAATASYRRCADVAPSVVAALPPRLADTGLYAPDGTSLAEGVRPFTPRFELWSDGATKRRFIALPPGSVIDTSDMDAWRFPAGTKLWKEFTRDAVRVETRVLQKIGDEDDAWVAAAYVWDDDGRDARLALEGVVDARGTRHDVPAASQCMGCHGGTASRVLGFSAVQLPWRSDHGASLSSLAATQRLTVAPAAPFTLPGDATAQHALGTLHANCAHCHNQHRPANAGPRCFDPRRALDLSLRTTQLAALEDTPFFRTALATVVVPGAPEKSALVKRVRGDLAAFQARMPPVATEELDPALLPLLDAFIAALPRN